MSVTADKFEHDPQAVQAVRSVLRQVAGEERDRNHTLGDHMTNKRAGPVRPCLCRTFPAALARSCKALMAGIAALAE